MISSALHTYLIGTLLLYKRFSAYDLIAFEGKFNTYPLEKFISAGHDVHKFKVASALQCSQRCLVQGGKCKGTNFMEKTGIDGLHVCEVVFNSKSSNEVVLQLISLKDWIYFSKVEFTEKTEGPKGSINHDQCMWLTSYYGVSMKCQDGYIGMGMCGSEAGSACSRPGNRSWTNLQCCKIESRTSMKSSCVEHYASHGVLNVCDRGKMVFQLCGSGKNPDCAIMDNQTKAATIILCCYDDALHIDNNECTWNYGASGSNQTCVQGYVLTGVCGIGKNSLQRCPGHDGHGIFCCRLK